MSWQKSTDVREDTFFSRKWVKLTQDKLFLISKSQHFLRVYISKSNKEKNTKFYTQYQINAVVPGFGKNKKSEIG